MSANNNESVLIQEVIGMAGMLQMRRSRGAASGFLLVLLGLWGALIPFIGPYFNYAYTPATTWTYTTARLWLEVLPGAAVFLGGVLLIIATGRHVALFGALLAAAGGAWFALGPILSPLWNNHVPLGGSPVGTTEFIRIMEQLGFYSALGVVIVFIAAAAFGRILSVASGIPAIETVPPAETIPAEQTVPARTGPTLTLPFRRARTETLPQRHQTEETQTIK